MKAIVRIILLSLCLYSCTEKQELPATFNYDTEVIAVFAPRGIDDQSSAGQMYKGLTQITYALKISFRPVFPLTFEEGAETLARLAGADQKGCKRLIISTDPGYSEHLQETASQGLIVNTDSTKLLIFDGDFKHDDVYVAHVPYYAMMYKAGYIAGKMNDVENVRIYIANDNYRYIREGRDGFIDGFSLSKANEVDVYDYSTINDDDTEGFMMRNIAYMSDAHECSKGDFDMILPICGETIWGFLRYNRENPGEFYTVGVGADMSIYSSDVPFSCVEHLDRIVSACIMDWMDNRLQHYRIFGLDEGWVELVVSEQFKSLMEPLSREIHRKATEKEEHYAK